MTGALQAIVFDFDGVIANSEPLHLKAFQLALAQDGVELSAADYYARYLGYDDVGMFEALARDRGIAMSGNEVSELVARKGERMQALLRSGSVLFPGATEFIRAAAAAVPIAIASGAMRHEIEEVIDAAGMTDLGGLGHAREQAVASPVSSGARTASRVDRPRHRSPPVGRHRGFQVGPRVGAGRGAAAGRRDQQLPGSRADRSRARCRGSAGADAASTGPAVYDTMRWTVDDFR